MRFFCFLVDISRGYFPWIFSRKRRGKGMRNGEVGGGALWFFFSLFRRVGVLGVSVCAGRARGEQMGEGRE